MTIRLNMHKTIESLLKIKLPQLTIFLAIISSYNLWFLTIYFFNHDFILHHGYIITLLTTLALTTAWCLIVGITVPKYFLWYIILSCPDQLNKDDTQSDKTTMNLFVFVEIILVHVLFLWVEHIVHWSLFVFVTIAFLFAFVQFFLIDTLAKSAFDKLNEANK